MKTTNTFGVHFLIRQDKLKEGKAPVYARITVNTDRILIGLKQWIARSPIILPLKQSMKMVFRKRQRQARLIN